MRRKFCNEEKVGNFYSMKYVVVSGGTVSGLGKGTAISSLGVVLKHHGYRVTAMKIDPYLVRDYHDLM